MLNGASDLWAEHFLHDMGFKGPKPTHTVQNADCQETKPTVDYRLGACYPNGQFSSANLYLIFDNTASTVPVTFSVPNAPDVTSPVKPTPSIVRTVPAGQKIEVETTPIWQNGGSYTVQMSGVPSVTIPDADITIKPFTGCLTVKPGDPTSTGETCVAGTTTPKGGSITVGFETGLQYSIDGPGTAHDFVVVNQKTTTGLPAGDYIVKVAALPGYVPRPPPAAHGEDRCGQLPAARRARRPDRARARLGRRGGLLAGIGFAVIRKRAAGRHCLTRNGALTPGPLMRTPPFWDVSTVGTMLDSALVPPCYPTGTADGDPKPWRSLTRRRLPDARQIRSRAFARWWLAAIAASSRGRSPH